MQFETVIGGLREGRIYRREGWHETVSIWLSRPLVCLEGIEQINMKTAQGDTVIWRSNQADLLAKDWIEIEKGTT